MHQIRQLLQGRAQDIEASPVAPIFISVGSQTKYCPVLRVNHRMVHEKMIPKFKKLGARKMLKLHPTKQGTGIHCKLLAIDFGTTIGHPLMKITGRA